MNKPPYLQPTSSQWVTLVILVAAMVSTCDYLAPQIEIRDSPETSGTISSSLPEIIDPDGQYLFYLHGKIIEDQGVDAVSPQFGPYEYEKILSYFAKAGFKVISEVRPAQTEAVAYANQVAIQVNSLLAQGVPSENITIVGFSKGGGIAIITSSILDMSDLNFVLIAICGDWIYGNSDVVLAGRILSLIEKSDPLGSTCQPLIDRSPSVIEFVEIEFSTGKQHGAFYSADPTWLDPMITWLAKARIV